MSWEEVRAEYIAAFEAEKKRIIDQLRIDLERNRAEAYGWEALKPLRYGKKPIDEPEKTP